MATKIADIRFSNAFKQLQGKGFVPIKFHFRDTYSWGMESTTEPKITVELQRKQANSNNLWSIRCMPFSGGSFYTEAETHQIVSICRKLMKQNEVTYHLYGFGQYNRGTTNLEAAVNQLTWWATYCKSRGVESDECNDIEKAFAGMKAGETKYFYSKGGNHIASLVRNY